MASIDTPALRSRWEPAEGRPTAQRPDGADRADAARLGQRAAEAHFVAAEALARLTEQEADQ